MSRGGRRGDDVIYTYREAAEISRLASELSAQRDAWTNEISPRRNQARRRRA
jgi:hypothetical protein